MDKIFDVDYNILLNLDINDFAYVCQVNKRLSIICSDYYFWKRKFSNDNIYFTDKGLNPKLSNVQYYVSLYNHNKKIINIVNRIKTNLKAGRYTNKSGISFIVDDEDIKSPDIFIVDPIFFKNVYNHMIVQQDTDGYFFYPAVFINYVNKKWYINLESYTDAETVNVQYSKIWYVSEDMISLLLFILIDNNIDLIDINGYSVYK